MKIVKTVKRITIVLVLAFIAVMLPMATIPYFFFALEGVRDETWSMGFMTGFGTFLAIFLVINSRKVITSFKRSWG